MRLDLKTIAERMRKADTEELLDRVTVFRDEMEPAAVDLIEGELARRGLTEVDALEHDLRRRERIIMRNDGSVVRCSFCERPAVHQKRGWLKILRVIPIVPRVFARCEVHEQHPTPVEEQPRSV
jgi:hypothetical protein